MITGQQVREAVAKANITVIEHHDCGGCGYMTAYLVKDGELFFDPGCDCSRYGPSRIEPRSWDDAAAWINMQDRTGKYGDIAAKIAAKFGIELEPPVESTPSQ